MNKTYLAFYKGKGTWIDKLIRYIDGSKYSHVEFVIKQQDGKYKCYSSSARDGGVRLKYMNLNSNNWDLIPIKTINNFMDIFFIYQFSGYDYLGLFSTKWGWFPNIPNRVFCSELVAKMLGIPNAETYGIKKLYDSLN